MKVVRLRFDKIGVFLLISRVFMIFNYGGGFDLVCCRGFRWWCEVFWLIV